MKVSESIDPNGRKYWSFTCPGCPDGMGHEFAERMRDGSPGWEFNGDLNNPTFSPSLLVRFPWKGENVVCHSFVRNGRIEFLSDCTHELAGQTVDLYEME